MEFLSALALARQLGASDLHIISNQLPRVRLDGELVLLPGGVLQKTEQIDKIINKIIHLEEKSKKFVKELDCALELPIDSTKKIRFRVNVFQMVHGSGLICRFIPTQPPTLEQLNLPKIIQTLCETDQGLILIAGATGSGKSTTLAAMIDKMNMTQARHIITLEDPIEFLHASQKSLVTQREIHQHTQNFQSGLRAALREDPDVILVGELRDLETIRLALTAAETGHLVLATVHASTAPRTIHRLLDVFSGDEKPLIRNMLAESLCAIICQKLIKKPTSGRYAAHEILLATPAVRNLIREDRIAQMVSVMQTGGAVGMCTFEQSLQSVVRASYKI